MIHLDSPTFEVLLTQINQWQDQPPQLDIKVEKPLAAMSLICYQMAQSSMHDDPLSYEYAAYTQGYKHVIQLRALYKKPWKVLKLDPGVILFEVAHKRWLCVAPQDSPAAKFYLHIQKYPDNPFFPIVYRQHYVGGVYYFEISSIDFPIHNDKCPVMARTWWALLQQHHTEDAFLNWTVTQGDNLLASPLAIKQFQEAIDALKLCLINDADLYLAVRHDSVGVSRSGQFLFSIIFTA